MRTVGLGVVALLLLGQGWACGSSDEETGQTSAGGHAGAAGNDASSTGGSGGDGSAGTGGSAGSATGGVAGTAATGGAPSDGAVDGPVLTDAGWFDCAGCACNGATHYCATWSGGIQPPKPDPDANVCVEKDGGWWESGCTPLPADCGGTPSCGCLALPLAWCKCDANEGGLRMSCPMP